MKKTIALFVVIALAGCEQADPEPQSSARPLEIERALSTIEFSRAPGFPMDVLQERVDVAVDAMYYVADGATSWETANELATKAIDDAEPGVIRASVEQAVSKLLLVGYLVPNHADSGTSDLALTYAQRLVENNSPEAEALVETVETFGPEWEPAARRAVAVGAADAVEAHVRGGTSCVDCDVSAEVLQAMTERGQTVDVVAARRLASAERLRELAE